MRICTALTFFCIVLLQDRCSAAPSGGVNQQAIESGPSNIAIVRAQTLAVTLQCCLTAATVSGARIQWWEYGTRNGGSLISDGDQLLAAHPNSARYRLNVSADARCYTLIITSINLRDATKYNCIDTHEDSQNAIQRGAQLVVIDENPLTINTLPAGVEAVEGTYYTMEISLVFNASYPIAPTMTWTGPAGFVVEYLLTNTSAWSGLAFTANRSMDGQTFNCVVNFTSTGFGGTNMAPDPPTWSYPWTSPPMAVRWPPSNMYILPDLPLYDIGTNLTCFVDSNPVSSYFWQAIDGPLAGKTWSNQSITLTIEMAGLNNLRCHAQNTINGLNNTADQVFPVDVDFFNACLSNPCQFGGTCVREGNGYSCTCIPGITGTDCTDTINNCLSMPCQNNGTCVNNVNSYMCFCPPGITGTNCETNINAATTTVLTTTAWSTTPAESESTHSAEDELEKIGVEETGLVYGG